MALRVSNPSATLELIPHSLGLMAGAATQSATLAGMGTTALASGATHALIGGSAGSVLPGAGTAAGAGFGFLAGAGKGLIGGLSGMVDAEATVMEILKEELGDKEPTPENIQAVFEREDVRKRMQFEATARGVAIGLVDTVTMGLAGQATKQMITKPLIKRAVVATGIESVGGATGELAAQLVSTGEVDWEEVTLEGLMEVPMGGVSLAMGATSTYELNGERVSADDIYEFTESGHLVDEKQIKVRRDKDLRDHVEKIRKAQDPVVEELKQKLQVRANEQGKQLFGVGLDRAASHAFKKYNEAKAQNNVSAAESAMDAAIDNVSVRYKDVGVFDLDIDQQSSGQRASSLGRSRFDSESNIAHEMINKARRIRLAQSLSERVRKTLNLHCFQCFRYFRC